MDNYKTYLAEQVLSEDRIVTYRTLSRALKVHVNTAKQMLYEFHNEQNVKRSGSVHATYMLYGIRKNAQTNGHSQQDGDVHMTSSPPELESAVDDGPVITLTLVAEESLKDVLSQYESVSSIHVYSLGTHPVKDLHLLAEVSKPILDVAAEDGSADRQHSLGPIRNPYARRRERQGGALRPNVTVSKASDAKPTTSKQASAAQVKEEAALEQKSVSKESTPVLSGSKKPPPAPKRGASGGIMQSFAKAASKPKKAGTPQPTAASAADDSPMQELSDDGEDDTVAEPKNEDDTAAYKTRKDRQEELKRMMEEDSEDEEPDKEDTPMEEPGEDIPAPEPENEEKPEPAEVISSANNGRRRGKRRVMKKKTIMDDQGYLVTVQESGWESFSEDEPAPPAAKKKAEAGSQPAKPKKPAAKGQGNIMSFFSKK
ncbi:hypothetical protein LA080_004072 [Diaporthe eres]|uniref:DNA polymerase delta subunit 3 n=1 Tax=Diaporthe vaccinii TaxID=105482 RepID=A0ABR4EJ06_9PEZI|nr:hypothetical protein LA080_004072 [Diaporthe eres]